VALALDVIYQIVVLRWVYPVQTMMVAAMLAIVPDLVVRGLANRIGSQIRRKPPSDNKGVSPHDPRDCSEGHPGT
jgi:hypothetical protein